MKHSLTKITPLLVVFTVLLSSSFIDAAWIAPSGAPSAANNAPAPINVSAQNQVKTGDLTALNLKAGSQVWSAEYCDEHGNNCTSSLGGNTGMSGIQTGVVSRPARSGSTDYVWVPFPTPFTAPPNVVVIPNAYTFSSGCSNSPWFVVEAGVHNVTEFGFTARMSGHGVCGGAADVQRATWIAF